MTNKSQGNDKKKIIFFFLCVVYYDTYTENTELKIMHVMNTKTNDRCI